MRNPSGSSSVAAAAAAAATTRTKTPCCSKIGLKRGPWTPEEDELLSNYIKKEGEGRWRTLPKRAGLLRCGKSCRLRWMNYLRPSVKRGQIAPDEEDLILRLHRLLGNRWSLIAGRIPGRTDNEIKNYWNTHLSKKLISQGIDPRTHKPLNPIIESGHQDQLKASSSKAAANHRKPQSPKPNPPVSSGNLEETTSGSTPIISNKENNENLQNTNQAHYHSSSTAGNAVHGGYASLLNGDGCDNEDNEDLNYCTDDIFSSFLNSLINEEAFTGQQHQMQEVLPNVITAPSSDPLVSSVASSAFGFGTGWESAIMSSTSFDQSGSRRVDGHVE